MKATIAIFLIGWATALAADSIRSIGWREEKMAEIDRAANMDAPSRFKALEGIVRMGGTANMDSDTLAVWEKAREIVLATPGHGEFYQEPIAKMMAAVRAEPDQEKKRALYYDSELAPGKENYRTLGYDRRDAMWSLETLQYLPSFESVAALASFLSDPEGRDGTTIIGDRPGDQITRIAISCHAADLLDGIGIEKPPVIHNITSNWQRVDAWSDWWNEVKAGKRTYRFKGSPIEYGPDGPVAAQSVTRPAHDSVKASPSRNEAVEVAGGPKPQLIYWMVGGGSLLLLIGGWKFMSSRRQV